ncbi:hypothetical protein LTR94_025762, partial [Friedmanniomyces endolithicus]
PLTPLLWRRKTAFWPFTQPLTSSSIPIPRAAPKPMAGCSPRRRPPRRCLSEPRRLWTIARTRKRPLPNPPPRARGR